MIVDLLDYFSADPAAELGPNGADVGSKDSGRVLEFDLDGSVLSVCWKGDSASGPYTYSRTDGLLEDGFIFAGALDGVRRFWLDGINVQSQTFVRGRLHGEVMTYDPKSEIRERVFFEDGCQHGLAIREEVGLVLEQVGWKRGMAHGLARSWHRNRSPRLETAFEEGQLNGELLAWRESGGLVVQGAYSGGRKEGDWTHFSETGDVECEVQWGAEGPIVKFATSEEVRARCLEWGPDIDAPVLSWLAE